MSIGMVLLQTLRLLTLLNKFGATAISNVELNCVVPSVF